MIPSRAHFLLNLRIALSTLSFSPTLTVDIRFHLLLADNTLFIILKWKSLSRILNHIFAFLPNDLIFSYISTRLAVGLTTDLIDYEHY